MSVEIYKTANAQISFICEAMLGSIAGDGKLYNKISLTLVLRDRNNKALKTSRYYLDVPAAKVIFHDIWQGYFNEDYNEFKRSATAERALQISPTESEYRISIMNSVNSGERDRLYFSLSKFQARQLAISVLDHLKAHEISAALIHLLRSDHPNLNDIK